MNPTKSRPYEIRLKIYRLTNNFLYRTNCTIENGLIVRFSDDDRYLITDVTIKCINKTHSQKNKSRKEGLH
jgi:hypothetical protein